MLEKTDGTMKNKQVRDTGSVGNKAQNKDEQRKKNTP